VTTCGLNWVKKINIESFLIETEHAELLHQPETCIANRLIQEVTSANPPFTTVRILSAYTSPNGVDILEAILSKVFAKEKSANAYISIGIDRKRTSYGSLDRLLQLKGMFPNLNIYIVHDTRLNYTFHPKVYTFESLTDAFLFVGSSNLTKAGLGSNYEIVAAFSVDLRKSTKTSYFDFVDSIEPYFTPTSGGWVQELTYDLMIALDKEGALAKSPSENKSKSASNIFGEGTIKAAHANVKFKKSLTKKKVKGPRIALQLTHWDTSPRHYETQVPKDVLRNGFFPKNDLTLVFPDGTERQATLSHYDYHSRIYNKEILDHLNPQEGDILMLTRISPHKFHVRLVKEKNAGNLINKLTKKSGKGKRWDWL